MPERVVDIHALSPLLWRDGRPFTAADSTETAARSLPLPLPSTIAGFLRTQIGRAERADWNNHEHLKNLHGLQICAPLLVRGDEIVLPAPRDAVVFKKNDVASVMRLEPRELTAGEGTNLPEGLLPLEVTEDVKPEPGYNFWTAQEMERWLLGEIFVPKEVIPGLPTDTRVHVAMDKQTGKGIDGQLYSVAYRTLESGNGVQNYQPWSIRARLSLPNGQTPASIGLLGGEGRPVAVEVKDDLSKYWFDCPHAIKTAFDSLKAGHRVRMVLATPAIFQHGWKPGWLDRFGEQHLPRGLSKVKLKLVAAAVGRREGVSGWNLRTNQPKAVRWMVPAGSVYFFEVEGGDPKDLLESWLRPVSDIEQDRKDGFGLAMWGVW